jgi:hypothetical protein
LQCNTLSKLKALISAEEAQGLLTSQTTSNRQLQYLTITDTDEIPNSNIPPTSTNSTINEDSSSSSSNHQLSTSSVILLSTPPPSNSNAASSTTIIRRIEEELKNI